MTSTLTIILVIGYLVFQIISAIITASARKQEEERLRQAAQRKRAGLEGGQVNEQTFSQAPAPVAANTARPMDELAARRKAQLEQLRNRRQGRKFGEPAPAPAPSRVSLPTSGQLPQQVGPARQVDRIDSFETMRRQQVQTEQRRQEAMRAKRERDERSGMAAQARAEREQAQLTMQRERERKVAVAAEAADRRAGVIDPMALPGTPSAKPTSTALSQRLHHRSTLRDLFVMKEVIDPPLSLRDGR